MHWTWPFHFVQNFPYIWVWIHHQKTTKKFHCSHFISEMMLSFWSSKILMLSIWTYSPPCIYEREQPNKNSEDNYEDSGFQDANYLNFFQKKTLLAYSKHFEFFDELCLQLCHIQVDPSILKATCINVQCYHCHHTWYVTSWFFLKLLFWMSMVEDVMMLARMMYRFILNQNCDKMELIPHLLLLGHFLLP